MRLLPVALLALLPGCLSVRWWRESRFEAPPQPAVQQLVPGQSDLAECLARLGAPLWVWEHDGDGLAMAYGWYESENLGFDLSIPVSQDFAASFDYAEIEAEMRGLVLVFDANLGLERMAEGLLRDLTSAHTGRQPAFVE